MMHKAPTFAEPQQYNIPGAEWLYFIFIKIYKQVIFQNEYIGFS